MEELSLQSNSMITITTDFGVQSQGLGQMRMIIGEICNKKNPSMRQPTVIDYMHGLPAHDITAAARTMETLAQVDCSSFKHRVHLCIVDPGVGTTQKRIIIQTQNGDFLVGPNNGVLIPAAIAFGGINKIVEIANPKFWNPKATSEIFHGRDRFAPAAAYLVLGTPIEQFGSIIPTKDLVSAPFTEATINEQDNIICASIIHINHYGSAHLNIKHAAWDAWLAANPTQSVKLQIGDKLLTLPIVKTFGDVGKGEILLVKDDYGRVCLAINQGRFSDKYKVKIGDIVRLGIKLSLKETKDESNSIFYKISRSLSEEVASLPKAFKQTINSSQNDTKNDDPSLEENSEVDADQLVLFEHSLRPR